MKRYLIPILLFIIVCIGLFTLYSATYFQSPLQKGSIFLRQLTWVAVGWLAYFVFSRIHYRKLINFIYPFYILIVLFLILVLAFGGVRLGAQRWIRIWWFSLQPSEFAKLAVILVLSHYFSRKNLGEIKLNTHRLSFMKGMVFPFLIIALPFLLILKQPDLGTALMLFFIFLGLVYYSGVKARYIFLVLAAGIIISPVLLHSLKDYQKERLLVFLNPDYDPLGAGYTIIQSKITIGSGMFLGRGWLSGTQGQLNFLPEAHTDFIFGIFSEEMGFLGSIILLGLYYFIVREAFAISSRVDDGFGKLLAFGIGLAIAIQVYVNISMTMGISPIVGLPLPLISYGGSSILVTFISLGILRNINKRGSYLVAKGR